MIDMNDIYEKIISIINDYDTIIIMGHKDPDLDSLGSSLGLYEIVESLKKDAFLFLNDISSYNSNVTEALNKIGKDIKVTNEHKYKLLQGKKLVIITDLHIQERLEYPNIIDEFDVVILDHHIKSKKYIKNSKYIYINSNLSSMSEFVTFFADYLNLKLDNVISTIILGGIEIDTNGYNLKTTKDTYLSASILMQWGADTLLKQELLKETKEEYMKRASFIRNSFMINSNTAMCVINGITNSLELAQTAEELLNFEDVKASYVIGRLEDKKIGVSARSIGDIDISKIIKKIGGGGHSGNAAAQISFKSVKEVQKEIIELINKR